MADKEEWAEVARSNNGGLVVWIDQGTDQGLQQVNSRGVCFALTLAWIKAFTSYKIERAAFVNSFRTNDPSTRIPAEYLDQQAQYSVEVKANRQRFENTLADLKGRIERGENVDLQGFRDSMLAARQRYYGSSCVSFNNYRQEIFGTTEVFRAPVTPKYCMLTMGERKHVVGFELRPDLADTLTLPNGLFEFFDANLGLFFFRSVDDLHNFWTEVHTLYYGAPAKSVDVATFGIGRGGFAKTWGELLNDLKQWIVAWWNSLWGTTPGTVTV